MNFTVKSRDLISVYDGDTFKISVECSPSFAETLSIRVLGIDTPEIKGTSKLERKLAIEARDHLKQLLTTARTIECTKVKWCKYGGRVLAYVAVDGKDVGKSLIDEGLARPYDGGKREPWQRRPKRRIKQGKIIRVKVIYAALFTLIILILLIAWGRYEAGTLPQHTTTTTDNP